MGKGPAHLLLTACVAALLPSIGEAATDAEIAALRAEIAALKTEHEARVGALEARLSQLETSGAVAAPASCGNQWPAENAPAPTADMTAAAITLRTRILGFIMHSMSSLPGNIPVMATILGVQT